MKYFYSVILLEAINGEINGCCIETENYVHTEIMRFNRKILQILVCFRRYSFMSL